MQVVRPISPRWNAHYLAAAVSNPANEKHMLDDAIRTHFNLEKFEIAHQPLADQEILADIAAQLEKVTSELREAAKLLITAQIELSNALASGSITATLR